MQPTIWNDERITAYVMGELSAEESSQLESEMRLNPEFAKAVAEATGITTQLSAMFAAEPQRTLDADKRSEIFESPDGKVAARTMAAAVVSDRAAWRRMLALAATVLLLGTLGTWLYAVRAPLQVATSQTEPHSTSSAASKPHGDLAMKKSDEFKGGEAPSDEWAKFGKKLETTETAKVAPAAPAAAPAIVPAEDFGLSVDTVQRELLFRTESPAEPEGIATATEDEVRMKAQGLASGPASAAADPARGRRLKLDLADSKPASARTELQQAEKKELAAPAVELAESEITQGEQPLNFYSSNPSAEAPAAAGYGGMGMGGMIGTDGESLDDKKSVTWYLSEPRLAEPRVPAVLTLTHEGRGAGTGGDRFEPIQENEFRRVSEEPLSTFSIDVDTASYSKIRQFLQSGTLPPAGAVRIEELVNYFNYAYEPPAADSEHPFASRVEIASCPWKPEHRLARIGIKGKVIENQSRPASNLVFLVDTSGSMNEPNKLPLVKQGLQKLVSQLRQRDRVAIVVYAGSAGLVLDSTSASDQSTILRRINQMQSGGSTNGGQGIRLAYQVARDHFISDGVNRVILCSDGDFNVGTTSDDELVRLVETESKGGIDITVLGFGMGNHNDSMMEKISGRGNGNYAFIDSEAEAQRVLVEQTSGTLVTIARDVKIQVEFNPAEIAAYRLIGYENRKLANEDFKDDTKDAGEIGAGHSVTALYELIPATGDVAALAPSIDELRYQKAVTPTDAGKSGEWMTVKLRYKKPDSDTSVPVSFPATGEQREFAAATIDFRFAAAVVGFGMLLRSSEHAGNWTLSDVQRVAMESRGNDSHGLRAEFIELAQRAAQLRGSER